MTKAKTRKLDVKRLIDESGNVQAMIYIEVAQNKRMIEIGFRSKYSYKAAPLAIGKTDLWQYCGKIRNSASVINGKNTDMGYVKDFFRFATDEEKETLRKSAKYPFSFYLGSVLNSENLQKYFLDSLDEVTSTLRYETEILLAIAKERNWKVI